MRGHIDLPPEGAEIRRGPIRVLGWVLDGRDPRTSVEVHLGEAAAAVRAETGLARPDVAVAYPDVAGAETAGWEAHLDLSSWREDTALMTAIAIQEDGARVPFAERRVPVGGAPPPHLEAGEILAPSNEGVVRREVCRVAGWALSDSIDRVEVFVDGRSMGAARLGLPGPAFTKISPMPEAAISGFEHLVDLSGLPRDVPGARIGVVVERRGGSTYALPEVGVRLERKSSAEGLDALGSAGVESGIEPSGGGGDGVRLLVVTHSMEFDGGALWLVEILERLASEHDVSCAVAATSDGPLSRRLEAAGIPVRVVGPCPVDDPSSYEAGVGTVARWATRQGFNVLLANTLVSFWALDVAGRLGLPSVWLIQEPEPPREFWVSHYPPPGLHPLVRARAESSFDAASVLTFAARSAWRYHEPVADPTRSIVLPVGIDLGEVDASRAQDRVVARKKLGMPQDATIVLSLSAVARRKSQALLVQAFARVADEYPEAVLVCVGSATNPYAEALREYVAGSGLSSRVLFMGATENAYAWYPIADLFASASDAEGGPRVVREAMAFGLTVLCTAVGDLSESIEHGRTGWVVEPRHVGALEKGLREALALDPERRRSVGEEGARLIRDLDGHRTETSARAYLAIIRALAARPNADPARILSALAV